MTESNVDEATVEAFLDSHPDFFEDYFQRKASRRLVDSWTYRRARGGTGNSMGSSFSDFQLPEVTTLTIEENPRTDEEAAGVSSTRTQISRSNSNSCSSSAIRKASSELASLERSLGQSPMLTRLNDGSSTFIVDQQQQQQQQQQHQLLSPRHRSSISRCKSDEEENLLRELLLDIFHELDVTVLCHKILKNVCRLICADRCSLFLVETVDNGANGQTERELVSNLFDVTADSQLEEATAKGDRLRLPIGHGIVGCVAATGEPERIEDAYQDPRFNPEFDKKFNYKTGSVLCMPVKDHDGEVIGVTQAVNKAGNGVAFTEKDERTFEIFLTFCGIGIRNAKLFRQSHLETKRNQILLDLVRIVFEQQGNLDPLVHRIMHYMQMITACKWCQVLLFDDPDCSERMFDRVYELYSDDDYKSEEAPISDQCRLLLNSEIIRQVCDSGEPLNIPNASTDERLTEVERLTIACLLGIPIKNAQSQVVGLCLLMNKWSGSADDRFTRSDLQLAEAFALFCGLGIHSTRMYEKAEEAKRRQAVALEVLGYHAVAPADEAEKLRKRLVPSARFLGIADFQFSDFGCDDNQTLLCAVKMFEDIGAFAEFKIDYFTFCRWLLSVKRNYRSVKYHNWRHALNVTQCMFAMMRASPDLRSLSRLHKLALLIACISHDLDHRGTDNSFQQLTLSPLAQLYSSSMLEHHHFNQCIMLLSSNGCDILSSLSQSQYQYCIELVEQCILATDLQKHFASRASLRQISQSGRFSWSNPTESQLIFGLLMTSADLSAITKPWDVQKRVAQLVADEFYEQGDIERGELHLQPDPLKDRRRQEQLPEMQVGFIDGVCEPVYEILCSLFSQLRPLLNGCQANRREWAQLASCHNCEADKH